MIDRTNKALSSLQDKDTTKTDKMEIIKNIIGPANLQEAIALLKNRQQAYQADVLERPFIERSTLERISWVQSLGWMTTLFGQYVDKIRREVNKYTANPGNCNLYSVQKQHPNPFNIDECNVVDTGWASFIAEFQVMYHAFLAQFSQAELDSVFSSITSTSKSDFDIDPQQAHHICNKISALDTANSSASFEEKIKIVLRNFCTFKLYLENCAYLRNSLIDPTHTYPTLQESLKKEQILCRVNLICQKTKQTQRNQGEKTGTVGLVTKKSVSNWGAPESCYLVTFLEYEPQLPYIPGYIEELKVVKALPQTEKTQKFLKKVTVANNPGPRIPYGIEPPRYYANTPPLTAEEVAARTAERHRQWAEHFRQLQSEPVQTFESPVRERYMVPPVLQTKPRPKVELAREVERMMALGELVDPTLAPCALPTPDIEAEIQASVESDPWGQWIVGRINEGPLTSADLRLIANQFHLGVDETQESAENDAEASVEGMRVTPTTNGVKFSYTVDDRAIHFVIHRQHGAREDGFTVAAKTEFLDFLMKALEMHYRYAQAR